MASRRPATRAAASVAATDENRAITTLRSTKNAGLALRSRNANSAASSSTLASQKDSKPEVNTGVAVTRRRTALADSSNKVPQNAAGGRGAKAGGADKERLIIVAEDEKKPLSKSTASAKGIAAAARPSMPRRTTRSSLPGHDGDAVMEAGADTAAGSSRPVKSMRSSTTTTTAGLPATQSVSNGALASRPTNIPRRSSTTGTSTKNAGLKRSLASTTTTLKASTTSVQVETNTSTATAAAVVLKKSTKNAGLRLKREIQALESDDGDGASSSSRRHSSAGEDESKSARAARQERRQSKRLRKSNADEDAVVPSTSTSAAFQSTNSEPEEAAAKPANRSVAEIIQRVLDVSDDEEEADWPYPFPDDDDEDAENIYEEAKDAGWEDLDAEDADDPMMVAEYVREIHDYMQELEVQCMPDAHYMDRQSEVNWAMRSILVDWLVEVHGKFRLLPETIFLAVNIMDRLLSIRTVSLVKFQLVGIVSLQLASKYEEVVCPSVSSFLYMTDGCYSEEELLAAERYVLKQIDFNLSYPNPINFLRRISKADGYDIQTRTVAKYFIEMSTVDRKFMQYTPSLIAAAGMWLARKVLDKGYWTPNLIHYSTYSQLEILPVAQLMLDYVLRRSQSPGEGPEHPHFYKKYSAKKFYRAAEIVRAWAERRYVSRRPFGASSINTGIAAALFNGLEGGGRLEEWEDEGEAAPEVDFD